MRIRLLLATAAQAQTAPPTASEEKLYTDVEQMIQPPGDLVALMQALA